MAFSAQPDHGQTGSKEEIFAGIGKPIPKGKIKFVPNPAAKPFIPSCNLDVTESNRTSSNYRGQGSHPQVRYANGDRAEILSNQMRFSSSLPLYRNSDNCIIDSPLLLQHPMTNGISSDDTDTPTTPQPSKHIALHLLSKVLDDETIFNFTSIDESGSNMEPFSPVAASFPPGQGFDGTAHSWPIASHPTYPHPVTVDNIPGITTDFGSFPGQNIWSNESNNNNTPPISPSLQDPASSLPKRPIRPTSLPTYERQSPMINGYLDDQSPYPSPNGQSYGSSNASPHQSFLPIQDHYTNGRSQQSCESGYYSNSNNGSCYGVPVSPSSGVGYVPSPPEPSHAFILPLSGPGSQFSSPSMSPSSPPLSHIGKGLLAGPDTEYTGSPVQSNRDKCFPSPSHRRENGFTSQGFLQRKSPLMSELHVGLDKCCELLRLLEKERRRTEAEVSHLWSGRRLSNSSSSSSLRLPPNASRVDKVIVDQLREHSKVETLVSRIERIRHSPLHISISEAVDQWHQSICEVRARRQDEISSGAGRSRLCSHPRYQSDTADLQALVQSVKELCNQTRLVRTTVWCAAQLVSADSLPPARHDSFTESDTSTASMPDAPQSLEGTGEVS